MTTNSNQNADTSQDTKDGQIPEKTNRFKKKFLYLITKKKVIVPFTALVTMLCIAPINIPFIDLVHGFSQPNAFNIILGATLLFLAVSIVWTIIQSTRIQEHKITKREQDKVLNEVSEHLPDDKLIYNIIIDRSNGERLYFDLQTLRGEVDKNLSISGKNVVKGHYWSEWLCATSKNRIAVPMLLTALVFGNITFPLVYHVYSGVEFLKLFSSEVYTNPYLAIIPLVLLLGLAIACISNIRNTKFEKVLYIHKEEDCNQKQIKCEIKKCILDLFEKENKTEEKEEVGPLSSRITRVFVEFVKVHNPLLFIVN